MNSNEEILKRLLELENKFKMRGDHLEDIEQALEDIESNVDSLYNFAVNLVRDLDCIKDRLRLNDNECDVRER